MKEQKIVYLTRRQTEVEQLKESLAQNSLELSLVIGHRLKGHGDTFGFPEISRFGVVLEEAARSGKMDLLKEVVNSLDEIVKENLKIINEMK